MKKDSKIEAQKKINDLCLELFRLDAAKASGSEIDQTKRGEVLTELKTLGIEEDSAKRKAIKLVARVYLKT